jgi:hypothetical protein
MNRIKYLLEIEKKYIKYYFHTKKGIFVWR